MLKLKQVIGKGLTGIYKYIQRFTGRLKNEEFKALTLQSLPFWVASIITGIVAVLYSKIFHWVELLHEKIHFQYNYFVFLFIPLAFFVSWFLIYRFCQSAAGSGIPQLLCGIELSGKRRKGVYKLLNLRVIVVKILSSVAMLLGGGAIGREGPTIQISGSIFNMINKYIPKEWPKINRKLMLISGGAAGLAAAFNTPLGGIVFAIEELGKTHLNAIRTHLFIAVIIAGLTSQLFLGSYLYLGTPSVPSMTGWAFIYVILAAVLAGLSGHFFSKFILRIGKFKGRFKSRGKKVAWVLACGFGFALLVFFTGNNTVGSGKPLMTELLFDQDEPLAWFTFPSRFFGSIMTYVAGGAGGVFAPSLAIGASLGDSLVSLFQIEEYKNLIIIVSMIGFMTGVTHSPFTSFILVLEMTDRHTSVFPMMLASVIAFTVAYAMDKKSFYEHLVEDYLRGQDPPAPKPALASPPPSPPGDDPKQED